MSKIILFLIALAMLRIANATMGVGAAMNAFGFLILISGAGLVFLSRKNRNRR